MTSITVTYLMPDDMHDFAQAHHAPVAWAAISDSLNVIRNHLKHDALTHADVIKTVGSILSQAQGVLQCL